MPISLRCSNPDCNQLLTVRDELVGRRVRCPACAAVIAVSAAPETPPTAFSVEPPRGGDRSAREDRLPRDERPRRRPARKARVPDLSMNLGLSWLEFVAFTALFLLLPAACVVVSSVLHYVWRSSQPRRATQINILGFAVFAVQAVLAGLLFFAQVGGPSRAVDQFFKSLEDGKLDAAYEQTSRELRGVLSREKFAADFEDYGRITGHSFPAGAAAPGNQVKFVGSIESAPIGVVPVTVFVQREGFSWKVHRVTLRAVNPPRAAAPPDPRNAEYDRLAADSLLLFGQSAIQGDFGPLYDSFSGPFKSSTSPEHLRMTFKEYVDKKIDMSGLRETTPKYDSPPAVSDQGKLALEGRFPTAPSEVWFRLVYVREAGNWKANTLRIQVVPQKDREAKVAEMKNRRLMTETLLDFNRAVQAKDFAPFREKVSSRMKSQYSAKRLEATFKQFIDRRVDISAVEDLIPKFDFPVSKNAAGELVFKGYFPAQPNQIRFELAYVQDPVGWKLKQIHVKVAKEQP